MYQTFYKLHGKPFQLTPDPGMLFPSKEYKRAMSYLLYGFEQGEGFVMITGPVGAGKTLLIQKLFEELGNRNIAMASIASANLDSEDILPAVASAFELPYERRSKEALLQDLKQHLIAMRNRRSQVLLVVDEAQTLTPAALEMLRILSNLQLDGRALLQIFLVGQTDLRRTIISNRMEQLRQRIIASHKLEPLGREECQAYILHRLHAVGWNHDPVLAEEVFAGVHRASRGIPRKINLIMDRLLLHGYLEELHFLDQKALTTVLEEIREEMADVPPTLEIPAPSAEPEAPFVTMHQHAEPARPNAASERETELAALELKRSNILLQLLREEVRLKEMLQTGSSPASGDDGATTADIRRLRSGHDGK